MIDHPYSAFLEHVTKPNRYTGAEHGIRRKAWEGVQAKICLAFPDIYDIGMSHLGFRILYKILNEDERTLAERCYTPWVDMQRELKLHGELLRSLESKRPLCDFDVVGFSLQYELTFTNILTMLDLSGIPLQTTQRSDDDPLIVAGGPVATHAEPMAQFLDAILIGDGESATTEIALCWVNGKREGLCREERLRRLAKIPGVYVPSLYSTHLDEEGGFEVLSDPNDAEIPFPIERRLERDLSLYPFPDDGPVGGPEAIFDRMSIEVARGCTEGCRFCQAGMIYRPVRERDPQEVVDTVISALKKSGQDEVSLTALSTADVSCVTPLIKTLVEKTAPARVGLSVASLRAYGLAEDLLQDMRKVRASGLTFAPEAGTQRMRNVINKNVTEAQLLETADRVFRNGFDKMKLYFIIGLPTEEDEDVLGILDVGKNALAAGKKVGKRAKVTVSVSIHIPKPHTPFQWCAQDTPEEVARKQTLLRLGVRGDKALQLRMHDSKASLLEGILARGDRRLGPVIERAFLNGARFDSWDEHLKSGVWDEALAHYAIPTETFLGTIPVSARLPWDHLDIGLEDGFLLKEYRKALRSRLSPPCGKVVGQFIHATNVADAQAQTKRLVCYDCGIACDMTRMREQRVEFLSTMGSTVPAQPVRLPVVLDPSSSQLQTELTEEAPGGTTAQRPDGLTEELPDGTPAAATPLAKPKKKQKLKPSAYRPPQVGEVSRWRFRFSKTGASVLLGHLDTTREIPRVIRRAGMKTAYSEGFHPRPLLSFSPALSVGIASLGEYLDATLLDAPKDPETLLKGMNSVAAGGFRFSEAISLPPQSAGLGLLITEARYLVAIARSALTTIGGVDGLQEKIDALLKKSSVKIRRSVKGLSRFIDVREGIETLKVDSSPHAHALLASADFRGNLLPLSLTIAIGPRSTVRVAEVMEALTGDAHFPHFPLRVAQDGALGSPSLAPMKPKKAARTTEPAESKEADASGPSIGAVPEPSANAVAS